MVKTYIAHAERDGRFWHIRVNAIRRSTQARHLKEVEPMASDLIAVMEDMPTDSFHVEMHVTWHDDRDQQGWHSP
jgi:hypothetical protein